MSDEERVSAREPQYQIPASLVHRLITSIIVAIVTIGGYMILWAINDAASKASWAERLNQMEKRLDRDVGKDGP